MIDVDLLSPPPPANVDAIIGEGIVSLTLRGPLDRQRSTRSAAVVAVVLAGALSVIAPALLTVGLLVIVSIGACVSSARTIGVEHIEIDRRDLTFRRGLGRRRTLSLGALQSVRLLRSSWAGARELAAVVHGPGRAYLTTHLAISDDALVWINNLLARVLAEPRDSEQREPAAARPIRYAA